jgi:tRNA pseudouridine13 synthase
MNCLDAEKQIGIETFFTPFVGVSGKLRTVPEDFVVREISQYPPQKDDGRFTIAEVTATNWETNLLIRELSNRLHISRKRIGFAGTKDKRATTTRLMSFYHVPQEALTGVSIKDVRIENIYSSDRPVKIGVLSGNRFEIIIREVSKKIASAEIEEVVSSLRDASGFPNFYGIQRFGAIRPITHLVGKHIVHGNFEQAVMSYVANPIKGEDEEAFYLREQLQQTRDFAEALRLYPPQLNFEKAMLNKLVVDPEDFVGALKELPKNLLTMFVYAYQSYLFNKIVSERIRRELPLNSAVIGDVILPVRKGMVDDEVILVTQQNVSKVNIQISRGKAVVSGLLFGSDSIFSEGEMGEIEHGIIDEEKLDHRDFIIPEIPYISSSGSRRPLLASVRNLKFSLNKDELHEGKHALTLKFELRKGCYATSLLREFMKADDIRKY